MYTTMLELAISMAFLFLMLSAASSAIQEIIANMWRWRATTLEKGIASLLRSNDFKNELYKLPLLEGLCSPDAGGKQTNKPSYIPSGTFALAVLHLAEQNGMDLTRLPSGAGGTPSGPTSDGAPFAATTALLQSLMRGAKDVEEQKKRLEDWFDNSMDRISGWYKRRSHAALWIIGILLCLLVNADSISLANAFWNDQTLRAAMVTAATEHVKSAPKPGTPKTEEQPTGNAVVGQNAGISPRARTTPPSTPKTANPEVKRANKQPQKAQKAPATADNSLTGGGTGVGTSSGVSGAQGTNTNDTPFKRLDDVRKELTKTNIPLGWCWYIDQSKLQKKCFPIFNSPLKPRPGPKDAKVSIVGNPGKTIYYYWIVANYKDSKSDPSGPFAAANSPDTLSDKNFVDVSWQEVQDAKGYDILRTPDNKVPTGQCNCAVTTAVSGLSFTDKVASPQKYTVETGNKIEESDLPDPRLIVSGDTCGQTLLWWWWKLVGIALTGLAISQGAPFWFDLLQKAVNLRLAGDAPDEKQKKK